MQKLEFQAMGCQMLVATELEDRLAEDRLDEVPYWFANWEKILSRFRLDSELNRLNYSSGSWLEVSQVLWDVLLAARVAWHESSGLVSPTILPALEKAGYARSFEQMGEIVSSATLEMTQIQQTFEEIKFDEKKVVCVPFGMQLDLGGIAKGWAAHQAMQQLSDLGPVLVDAGGDVALSGPLTGGTPWAIGINDPFRRGEEIEKIYVHNGGVATSGRDHRRWRQGAEPRHHIIDPRTGKPAETDLLSVTVIARDVMEAEMAAKTVLILGSQAGLDWMDHRENATGLAVREDGELLGSHDIENYLRS